MHSVKAGVLALCLALSAFAVATIATQAPAAELTRITPNGGLPRVALRHLAMNAAGDYVAVSNTRVFTGNVRERTVNEIFSNPDASFVLEASAYLQVDTQQITVSVDVQQTRLALNANGDFVVATNTRLYVGSARTKAVREVASSGRFTRLQQVAINDAGHYAAISDDKLFGGHVTDATATELVADAQGIFDVWSLYGSSNYFDGEVNQTRLALNARGQFAAVTTSAVYGGDLATRSVATLFYERGIGFRHVTLNDAGDVLATTDGDVFGGTVNP